MTLDSKPRKASPALVVHRRTELSPHEISDRAREAAEEILIAGEAANTRRSYESAIRYWCAWSEARYGRKLPLPVPVAMVVQFVVDHVGREKGGKVVSELPKAIDEALVAAGSKGAIGPIRMTTVDHRVAVLSKLHQLRKLKPNPCEDPDVRHLLSRARRAVAKRGETPRQKTAATREPLEAMLATCDDSLEGLRDRALLLFAWSSGGRRRSEVVAATLEQLTKVNDQTYLYRMRRSKTNQAGKSQTVDKPLRGKAAQALTAWLERAGIKDGPIFRRIRKSKVGGGLSPATVPVIVKKRALLGGVEGDWGAHSLRSGFVTEAGRRKVPLGDIMALTEHRQAATVMRYHRAGELFESEAANLLSVAEMTPR